MEPDFFAQFDMMSPEEKDQVMQLLGVPGQNDQLQAQLQQAQALRSPSSVQRSTGLGAAFQGIGDVVGAVGGGIKGNGFQGRIDANLKKLEDPNNPLFRVMALRKRAVPGSAGAGDLPPLDGTGMFGLG